MAAHGFSYVAPNDRTLQLGTLWDIFGNTEFRWVSPPNGQGPATNRECDIFGNIFQRVVFDTEWRTSTVLSIAEGIYASRDFSGMPILADALEEAGCDHARVLNHARSGSRHFRGCWVVDGLLNPA